jgi:hypothetical protein
MRTLTQDELNRARTQLELIRAIKKDADARHTYAHSAEFAVEKTQIEQVAYLLINKSIYDMLESQVGDLAELMGVDLDGTTEQKLATVIELFDGNRRISRR